MKTKKLLIALSALAVAALFASCGAKSSDSADTSGPTVSTITSAEAKEMIDAGDVTIVDVRTAEEYAEKHIDGAILIPNDDIGDTMPELLPDEDATILIYCRSGNRSAQAAKKLAAIGYTHIYDFGGINDWPYDTVSGEWDPDSASEAVGAITDATDASTSGDKSDSASSSPTDSKGDNSASTGTSSDTKSDPSSSSGTSSSSGAKSDSSASSGTTAPAKKSGTLASFSATTLDGKSADESLFSDYKLTMINVWATYCGPCLSEMPDLGELSSDYADKSVRIVGIVSDVYSSKSDGTYSDSDLESAKSLVKQTGASYTHLLPSADLNSAILNGVYAVPTTVFVDSSGNQVGKAYIGSRDKSDWESIIDSLLEEVN